MEVADAHRVGIAKGAQADLGGCPGSDAEDVAERRVGRWSGVRSSTASAPDRSPRRAARAAARRIVSARRRSTPKGWKAW